MSQAQSSDGKWLRTLRFIAKKIARRNAASAIWRATIDDDEHNVYAIALGPSLAQRRNRRKLSAMLIAMKALAGMVCD
jgi:hypothetical protein